MHVKHIGPLTSQSFLELAIEAEPVRHGASHSAKREAAVFAEYTVGREKLLDLVPPRPQQLALGIDDDVLTPGKDVPRM